MMPFHPLAEMFDTLEGDAFDEFAADIRDNGQQEPITVYEGQILDGRGRYRACMKYGITPKFICWQDRPEVKPGMSLVAWVFSANFFRRHIPDHRLTMFAARYAMALEAETKARQAAAIKKNAKTPGFLVEANLPQRAAPEENCKNGYKNGRSSERAASLTNQSARTVRNAVKVAKKGAPALVGEVESGRIAVSRAAKLADLPPQQQVEAIKVENKAVRADNKATERQALIERTMKLHARLSDHYAQLGWSEIVKGLAGLMRKAKQRAG